MIGTIISHYRIIEKLGEGGMGVVYKGEDTKLKRIVALKFLPLHFSADDEVKQRFMHEAQAASALNHSNICAIHTIEEFDQQQFIDMEFVEGKTLGVLLKEKELSLNEVMEIALQIAEGLNAAHKKVIVHRDIKPDNIMITDENNVKIMDFGLAKLKGSSKLTKTHSTLGTLSYMSPEQARGEEVDQRSDIFSFGAVLYEMITGRRPFKGEHEAAMMYSLVNETPEPLARYKTNVPDELQRVVDKALSKERGERYQHVDEMIAELRRVQHGISGSVTSTKKNSKVPWVVAAGVVVLAALGIYLFHSPSGPTSANSKTIAVLPFNNLSGDQEDEYFSDGIMEDILTQLSKIADLNVISRTTMIQYKDTKKSLKEIGKELNAGVVLEGSVRHLGNRIRIASQLIDAETDRHLWAETYDREMQDVFAIQSDVAKEIAFALKAKFSSAEKERLEKKQTENTEAYQLYLKGRFYWNKRRAGDLQTAIGYFNQAIEKDPGYALAYAGLASTYAILPERAGIPPKEIYLKAEALVNKALELDTTLAEPHAVLGLIKATYDWDWSGAERKYKKAIELNPNYPTTHHWYNLLLRKLGRLDEALAEIKRAEMLDPLSVIISVNVGLTYRDMRQYDQAIDQLNKVQILDPNYPSGHFYLGMVYAAQGKFNQASVEIDKDSLINSRQPVNISCLGHVYGRAGKKDDAIRMINKLLEFSKDGISVSTGLAFIYFGIGEKDKAFRCLDEAYEERSAWLLYFVSEPLLDDVQLDPRFIGLMQKMGLRK